MAHTTAFSWMIVDIKGLPPSLCKHRIQTEPDVKPVVQPQQRLNPNMMEVVCKEVIKLIEASIIYPISKSQWVNPTQVVPKKGGITVTTNVNNNLIPNHVVTSWRVCIDYRCLNITTCKDHFPLPFMDQILEHLVGKAFYCFLDHNSGYKQIYIAHEDHEKMAFTCTYGTFDFRCILFGLCNVRYVSAVHDEHLF